MIALASSPFGEPSPVVHRPYPRPPLGELLLEHAAVHWLAAEAVACRSDGLIVQLLPATDHRSARKNLRTSPTSRSGVSMAAKWPPRSNSDQCSISWSGSIIARTNGWAAKSAHPCGAVPGAPHSVECPVS